MENSDMAKSWEKPILIILVRNRPEENILTMCKTNTAALGADSKNNQCQVGNCQNECLVLSST